MTRSRSQGGHPNTIVVADDIRIVEHRGNAGRPHAAATKPIPHAHAMSFVFAPLQAEHVSNTKPTTTNPNPCALLPDSQNADAATTLNEHGSMPPPAVIVCRRSSASRSFVLAALRALHLDPSHAGGEVRDREENPSRIISTVCPISPRGQHAPEEVLDTHTSTGNSPERTAPSVPNEPSRPGRSHAQHRRTTRRALTNTPTTRPAQHSPKPTRHKHPPNTLTEPRHSHHNRKSVLPG